VSKRLTISNPGNVTFCVTGVSLNAAGVLPDGEVCVSRINLQPDVTPAHPDSSSTAYWILENYGNNIDIDTLLSLDFERTGSVMPTCDKNQLYTRLPNADGPVWGQAIDQADACTGVLPNDKITFSNGNSVYQSGQFAIGGKMWSPTSNNWFSFSASPYKEGTVLLNWTTGKEINTSHFIIERKDGTKGFKRLDSLAAAGNSGVSKNYQIIDKYPQHGLNEYRIKLVHNNGSVIYSDIKKLLFRAAPEKIIVCPNPQKIGEDVIIITEYRNLNYELFEPNGRLIQTGKIENNYGKISTVGLSRGSYNIIFSFEDKQFMNKIILQ
jgi:hypothetical protein